MIKIALLTLSLVTPVQIGSDAWKQRQDAAEALIESERNYMLQRDLERRQEQQMRDLQERQHQIEERQRDLPNFDAILKR